MSEELRILHRPRQNMFLARLAPGKYAFVGYEVRGGKLYITKTYTPPEFRGRGIATRLTEHVVRWAEEGGLKIVPVCSFAAAFFRKHKELRRLLDEEGLRALETRGE
ncbi:MAG: GNAT family N-acetyltransferase [Thermoprotei archaeon]|nr:MAG: GNAT family N-acetyltransferase [Thermoprotei archaeon]